ncbi:MAG: hypothetical protein ACRDE7_01085 [Sphingobacterium sp.]
MTTVENKISKAKRNFLIIGTAVALAVGFTACSEPTVEITAKRVTYEVSGHPDTYAVAYSKAWEGEEVGPYLSAGQRIINMEDGHGSVSFDGHPGDSISLFVLDASTYSRKEVANAIVTVGDVVVSRGNTEETGLLIVSGRLGSDLFKSCERK